MGGFPTVPVVSLYEYRYRVLDATGDFFATGSLTVPTVPTLVLDQDGSDDESRSEINGGEGIPVVEDIDGGGRGGRDRMEMLEHPRQPPDGVCAACLRERLIRLCPNCATVRHCGCFPSPSSSTSSSSDELGDVAIGSMEPVTRLIECEPTFRRSRSLRFELFRSKSIAAPVAGQESVPRSQPQVGRKGSALLWPFSREGLTDTLSTGMYRSRSVAAERPSMASGVRGKEAIVKGLLRWHFLSSIKVFWHRKHKPEVVAHE